MTTAKQMWTAIGASWHGVYVDALHSLIKIVRFFVRELSNYNILATIRLLPT